MCWGDVGGEKASRVKLSTLTKIQATSVMTFGLNLIGQLGNGHDRPIAVPTKILDLDGLDVTRIALGDNASAA